MTDNRLSKYNDLFQKDEVIDDRMKFAVNLGAVLVRILDKMSIDTTAKESSFELGSGEGSTFEILVRKK